MIIIIFFTIYKSGIFEVILVDFFLFIYDFWIILVMLECWFFAEVLEWIVLIGTNLMTIIWVALSVFHDFVRAGILLIIHRVKIEKFWVIFFEVWMESIFDNIFWTVFHEFWDFLPLGTILFIEVYENLVFLNTPGTFFDIWVQDINPPFTNLFTISLIGCEFSCNFSPLSLVGILTHQIQDKIIFLLCPWDTDILFYLKSSESLAALGGISSRN